LAAASHRHVGRIVGGGVLGAGHGVTVLVKQLVVRAVYSCAHTLDLFLVGSSMKQFRILP